MTSQIMQAIILVIDHEGGELKGTEQLALTINAKKTHVIKWVRALQHDGKLRIVPSRGGRGHRTVYRSTTARKLRNERR